MGNDPNLTPQDWERMRRSKNAREMVPLNSSQKGSFFFKLIVVVPVTALALASISKGLLIRFVWKETQGIVVDASEAPRDGNKNVLEDERHTLTYQYLHRDAIVQHTQRRNDIEKKISDTLNGGRELRHGDKVTVHVNNLFGYESVVDPLPFYIWNFGWLAKKGWLRPKPHPYRGKAVGKVEPETMNDIVSRTRKEKDFPSSSW
tara:strand:- start:46 stop:657 length:612 start_codon:yes stop_codon:yes gene_type:complete